MNVAVVIPVGPGRDENLRHVLACLEVQTELPGAVIVVRDGNDAPRFPDTDVMWVTAPKHEPGREQPRNIGARIADLGGATHVWFLDSDVIVEPDCLEEILAALDAGPRNRILVCPYDWMTEGHREPIHGLYNDPRWEQFWASPPEKVYTEDLSAGLACFSGNLVWPLGEFRRVGGFWSELHHGRCEDGELGVRAVAMGVPISFAAEARGWHMGHPVDMALALERNQRDVPMLDARHPWIQGSDVFMVDRDGKAFDVRCHGCGELIPTVGWWAHAASCAGLEIPVRDG